MIGKYSPLKFIKGAYRNSPWVVISVAVHGILFAALSVVVITRHFERDNSSATSVTIAAPREVLDPVVQPPEVIDRKSVPKNQDAELVSYEEDIYIPTEEAKEEDLYLDRGDPTALDNLPPGATGGTSIGVGVAGGHYGTGRPSAFAGRRAGGGGKGRGGGQTQGTEKAVLEGLRWLVRHQNPDGSWGADTFAQRCSPSTPCAPADHAMSANFNEGLTGLALLCFLGGGFSHESKQTIVDTAMGKKYRIGEVVKNGLMWLKDRQKEDGSYGASRAFMYNEALATLAMSEAYGLTQNRAWKGPAEKGIDFLLKAQKPNPDGEGLWGWRYASRVELEQQKAEGKIDEVTFEVEIRDADISVTGWVVMALKSADLSGIAIPPEAYAGAMNFTRWVTAADGLVGYTDPKTAGVKIVGKNDHYIYHPTTMSALGMLVRTFSEHDPNDPFLELAAKQIIKDVPTISKDRLSIDYYYWYYATLALNQFDGPDSPVKTGKYWGSWNKAMTDALLELQDKTEKRDVCSRGGWLTDDRWSHAGGALYNTAINTLTLQVYYRYENAFGVKRK